jgi:chromosome segregation ATPase
MTRSIFLCVCGVAAFVLFSAPTTYAQTSAAKPDQVMQELLSEVHQLRLALQQISVNAYRGQVMVERLRLQQEQVNRLAREVNSIRSEIGEIKAAQVNAKERLEDGEKKFDRGVMSDTQMQELRASLADFKRREEMLSERETQLSIELGQERTNLADLNKQLDSIEREMVLTNQVDQRKRRPK